MFRSFVLYFLTLHIALLNAQFSGINSFFSDTSLIALNKKNRVSSVTELVKEDSALKFNGRYQVNVNGRPTELVTGRGPYYSRMTFEYNKDGMVTKQVHYNNTDTSKVEYWTARTFDANNSLLKSVRGQMINGQAVVNTEFERKTLNQKKGSFKAESRRYDGARLLSVTISRDSISGKDTLSVAYEYGMDERTGKRVPISKTLIRAYFKDHCYYDDEISYRVFGKTETANKISTRFFQLDDKIRYISHGEINYDAAYEDFIQEHPEDFNPNYYSPLFVKAVLQGKIKGQRKPEETRILNEDGLLIQSDYEEFRSVMNYNDKKQLVEQLYYRNQEPVGRMQLWYNEKGLLVKTINTSKSMAEEDSAAMHSDSQETPASTTQETHYTYTYF